MAAFSSRIKNPIVEVITSTTHQPGKRVPDEQTRCAGKGSRSD
jgi:hypothetical protein